MPSASARSASLGPPKGARCSRRAQRPASAALRGRHAPITRAHVSAGEGETSGENAARGRGRARERLSLAAGERRWPDEAGVVNPVRTGRRNEPRRHPEASAWSVNRGAGCVCSDPSTSRFSMLTLFEFQAPAWAIRPSQAIDCVFERDWAVMTLVMGFGPIRGECSHRVFP